MPFLSYRHLYIVVERFVSVLSRHKTGEVVFGFLLCLVSLLVVVPCLFVLAFKILRMRVVNGHKLYLCDGKPVKVIVKGILGERSQEVAGVSNDRASINCDTVSSDFFFLVISESVSVLTDFLSKKKPPKSIDCMAPSIIAAHWFVS